MLNKKECEKALDSLRVFSLQNLNANLREVTKSNDVIEQLIKEHFDNSPLKFEELKPDMWVWDNYWCEWFEISEVYQETKEFDILIHRNAINKKRYETIKFEENRFYRKQVIKDD